MVRNLSHLNNASDKKSLVNLHISRAHACGTLLAKTPNRNPQNGVLMFGTYKRQQQQEETSLCAALVVFNLALLSLFIFICVK